MASRKDPRQRNASHHKTGATSSKVLEWASPAQREAFQHGLKAPFSVYAQPLLASGGFNATKTTAFILKTLYLSELFPGYRTVIARRVGKELRQSTLKSLMQWLPKEAYSYGGRLNLSEGEIVLNNGSEIVLLHLDDPETENVIRGLEINAFLFDQVEEIREEIFDLLMMRLGRWLKAVVPEAVTAEQENRTGVAWPWWSKDAVPRPLPPAFAMLTCNPDHELHWLYRRFHPESPEHDEKKFPDPEDPESGRLVSYKDLGYKMLFFSTLDNKFLTKQQKAQLLAKDEMYQRRFVRGEWGIPEGQIHAIEKASFIHGTREVVEFLQKTCKLHRSLDHGDTSPTGCLWAAVNDEQDVILFREYYMPNKLISEHRANIHSMSRMPNGEQERYGVQVSDPSMFTTRQAKGAWFSLASEYADKRICAAPPIFWSPADKDEMGTRDRISEMLRPVGPRPHPITREIGMWPRIFFVTRTVDYPQGCDHVIRETKAQKRVRIGTDGGKPIFSDDRDDNIADHLYDCLSGETEVLTRDGWSRIDAIPPTGEVWGLAGWQSYSDCRLYRPDAEMVKVETAAGAFSCTPDHKILTYRGWVRADTLHTGDTICTSLPSSYRTASKSTKDSATTSAESTTSAKVGGSIVSYMHTSMGRSPMATTFTTSTTTGPTIGPTTWVYLNGDGTLAIMPRSTTTPTPLRLCSEKLRSGTAALRAASGIVSTRWRRLQVLTSKTCDSIVRSAAEATLRLAAVRLGADSVARIARWLRFGEGTQVTQVSTISRADSYCLSVGAPHAFAINGGILVHNCLRYLISAGISKPRTPAANTRTQPTFTEVLEQRRQFVRSGAFKAMARKLRYA